MLSDDKPHASLGGKPLASALDLPLLNGELFAELTLDNCVITNRDLLTAFWYLAYYREKAGTPPRRVNYAALDVEELGSVYESLLEFHPDVATGASGQLHFDLIAGSERKTTGSYYTPPELVNELVENALVPVLRQRLDDAAKSDKRDGDTSHRQNALLSFKIIDIACGSGHMLLAAARRVGRELARLHTGEDEPAPERVRESIRDVISHCIYGVDRNPLAVDLCRVALWLESHTAGKPLTFLDHRIRCGDSLVGVFDLSVLQNGIPDKAFDPCEGDDKPAARAAARKNKEERLGAQDLFVLRDSGDGIALTRHSRDLDAIPDDSPELIRRKKELFEASHRDPGWLRQKQACDLWTASFFQDLTVDSVAVTSGALADYLGGTPIDSRLHGNASTLAFRQTFFHWPLEFPEVFAQGGFDVVLSNPPWERIKLQEQEFFAARDPQIAAAPNKAARKKLIETLQQKNPGLAAEFTAAVHAADCLSKFFRQSERYPLTATGDINTYAIFSELVTRLLGPAGRSGVIVPTGIATDNTTKAFFRDVLESRKLAAFLGMDNEAMIFPSIDHRNKFGLLFLCGREAKIQRASFTFSCSAVKDLSNPQRRFELTDEDVALLNPNTWTCPVFRTRADAELTKTIYRRLPVLERESRGENPWGIRFLTMFHMANDSGLFLNMPNDGALPLYEAKMMHQFDHRYATYEGATEANLNEGTLPQPSIEQKRDTKYLVKPRYWVEAREVYFRIAQLPGGLFQAIRDKDAELIILGLAHFLFGRWLLASKKRLAAGLFPAWRAFVESFPFAEGIAPTRLGLCGDNPASFSPLDASFLPAEPIGKIKHRARESTAWYAADEHAITNYLKVLGAFAVEIDDMPPLQTQDQAIAFVPRLLEIASPRWLLGFRDVTNNAVERTAIFDFLPRVGVGHKAPLILFPADIEASLQLCLNANFNSLVFDYVTRQKIGGVSLSYFILRQLPVLPPSFYQPADVVYVGSRVLELVYTADDMQPLADALRAASSPLAAIVPRTPYRWDEARRAELRAELDAWFARAYGLTRDELRYILDPADVYGPDFPGETFRVLKQKEIAKFGEYRTRRLVLEAWDRLPRA